MVDGSRVEVQSIEGNVEEAGFLFVAGQGNWAFLKLRNARKCCCRLRRKSGPTGSVAQGLRRKSAPPGSAGAGIVLTISTWNQTSSRPRSPHDKLRHRTMTNLIFDTSLNIRHLEQHIGLSTRYGVLLSTFRSTIGRCRCGRGWVSAQHR